MPQYNNETGERGSSQCSADKDNPVRTDTETGLAFTTHTDALIQSQNDCIQPGLDLQHYHRISEFTKRV